MKTKKFLYLILGIILFLFILGQHVNADEMISVDTWDKLANEIKKGNSVTIKLTKDLEANSRITIDEEKKGQTVTLIADKKITITRAEGFADFLLYNYGTLEIKGKSKESPIIIDGNKDAVAEAATKDVTSLIAVKNGATLNIENTTLQNNVKTNKKNGGAIYSSVDSNVQGTNMVNISNSIIQNNTGIYGGGIYLSGTICTIDNLNILNNTASRGGGIYLNNSTININDNTDIHDNISYKRKEIYKKNSTVNVSGTLDSQDLKPIIEEKIYTYIDDITFFNENTDENRIDELINQYVKTDDKGNYYVEYDSFEIEEQIDGTDDDFGKILKAHTFANELYAISEKKNKYSKYKDITVCAVIGKTYNIYNYEGKTATVKTNIDWKDAKFIIHDESIIKEDGKIDIGMNGNLFRITNMAKISISLSRIKNSISKGETNILLDESSTIGSNANDKYLCIIENSNKKQYIGYGYNANTGTNQKDMFLIDNNGNTLNDVQWNFDKITAITLYRLSNRKLSIKGGEFINNKAVRIQKGDTSFVNRGIYIVEASNVKVNNIKHNIDEDARGANYYGFIKTEYCADINVSNCQLYSRWCNKNGSTYDLTMAYAVNIVYDNIISDYTDTGKDGENVRWGITGTNYSKDITFKNCRLNRIDAHCGIYNLTVENCKIWQYSINTTGQGTLNVKNTTITSSKFINLRKDYGSTWNGTVNIEDCTFYPTKDQNNRPTVILAYLNYDLDQEGKYALHDFGYTCKLPDINISNITINDDNLKFDDMDIVQIRKDPAKADFTASDVKAYLPNNIIMSGCNNYKGNINFTNIDYKYNEWELNKNYLFENMQVMEKRKRKNIIKELENNYSTDNTVYFKTKYTANTLVKTYKDDSELEIEPKESNGIYTSEIRLEDDGIYKAEIKTTNLENNDTTIREKVYEFAIDKTKIEALMETIWGYYRKDLNVQYDSERKSHLVTPEDATSDELLYGVCGHLPYIGYKPALGIDVLMTTTQQRAYARGQGINGEDGEEDNSDFMVYRILNSSVDKITDENGNSNYKTTIKDYDLTYPTEYNEEECENKEKYYKVLSEPLKSGDIITALKESADGTHIGHAMMVESLIYDKNEVVDAWLIHSWGSNFSINQSTDALENGIGPNSLRREEDDEFYPSGNGLITRTTLSEMFMASRYGGKDFEITAIRPIQGNKKFKALKANTTSENYNNDNRKFSYTYEEQDVTLTDYAKFRLKYPGIDINKTSSAHTNSAAGIGEEITYKIEISNNSQGIFLDKNNRSKKQGINTNGCTYSGLELIENLSENLENNVTKVKYTTYSSENELVNTIIWEKNDYNWKLTSGKDNEEFTKPNFNNRILRVNIPNIEEGNKYTIEYTTKVSESVEIDAEIKSTGRIETKIDDKNLSIASATINNKVINKLNSEQISKISKKVNDISNLNSATYQNGNGEGIKLVNEIYREIGVNLNLTDAAPSNYIKKVYKGIYNNGEVEIKDSKDEINRTNLHQIMKTTKIDKAYVNEKMIADSKLYGMYDVSKNNRPYYDTLNNSNYYGEYYDNNVEKVSVMAGNIEPGDIIIVEENNSTKVLICIEDTYNNEKIKSVVTLESQMHYRYSDNIYSDGDKAYSGGAMKQLLDNGKLRLYDRVNKKYLDMTEANYKDTTTDNSNTKVHIQVYNTKNDLNIFLSSLVTKDRFLILRPSQAIRNINYELDGGVNSEKNPIAFIIGNDLELENPSKEGYRFKGWYTDDSFKNQVRNLNELTEDTTLYAKWETVDCEIRVTTLPAKNVYIQNYETIDYSGGELTVIYVDGRTEIIPLDSEEIEKTGFDNSKIGKNTITVNYDKATTTFDVTIVAKSIERIEVTALPTKKTYIQNYETIDYTGGELTIVYNDTSTEKLPLSSNEIKKTGFNNSKIGVNTIKVEYENFETTFDIEIIEKLTIIINNYNEMQEENNYLTKINSDTTIESLLNNITGNGKQVEIFNNKSEKVYEHTEGNKHNEDKKKEREEKTIGTGYKVKISLDKEYKEYTLIVTGDLNSNGKIDQGDILMLAKYNVGKLRENTENETKKITRESVLASDLNGDKTYAGQGDLLKIARTLTGNN